MPNDRDRAASRGISIADERRKMQENLRRECLAASCLDPNVPLGSYPAARPEHGPTAFQYYKEKHARNEVGAYYPLHKLSRGNPWLRRGEDAGISLADFNRSKGR